MATSSLGGTIKSYLFATTIAGRSAVGSARALGA